MAEKKEAKEAAPAGEKSGGASAADKEKSAPAAERPSASGGGLGGGRSAWIAAIAAIVLAPSLSWGLTQFVLLPHLEKKLASPGFMPAADPADTDPASADAKAKAAPPTYNFDNVVVNLSGTMGTRYLKVSFVVTGPAADLKSVFESNKVKMTDLTLNVLGALTLSDLEEPGSKNLLREKLVAAYNQSLGRKVVDQVYFSDFVIQ